MQIGFFGHSNCAASGPGTYLTIVAEHFNATIVNKGTGQGSEERILFKLKKCHNLDIAVIFHSRPSSLFLPSCSRDFDISSNVKKKADVIWPGETKENATMLEAFNEQYGDFKSIFKTPALFVNCITLYKKYLYHPDLHLNRFQGALMLIDSYCASKVSATVHIIDESYKPVWLTEFKSGVRSIEIEKLKLEYYSMVDVCGMLPEGHQKIADILIRLISKQLENKTT